MNERCQLVLSTKCFQPIPITSMSLTGHPESCWPRSLNESMLSLTVHSIIVKDSSIQPIESAERVVVIDIYIYIYDIFFSKVILTVVVTHLTGFVNILL